jgi:simple sugar transport system permease protein
MRALLRQLVVPVGAVTAGLILLFGGLASLGYDAPEALAALWRGAFGSWYAIGSATLVRAVPLIVIGLGLAIGFRAGALNIGAEGQFAAGTVAATWVGLQLASWPAPFAVLAATAAGATAGMIWIVLPVLLKLRFGVLEVISTLLLNFVAEATVSFLVLGPLQEGKGVYPQSDPIAMAARLPVWPGSRIHLGLVIGLVLAAGCWLVFSRTRWGFQLRAVGEAPRAAAITGRIRVERVIAVALLSSGAFAGLAGALEISGVTYSLYQNLSPGYGFTAIAVALIARLHPLGVVVAGIGFGALEAGAAGMQREAGVPAVAVSVVQAVVIIAALVSSSRAAMVRVESTA